jgi:glycosyl hydrolase family 26
MLPAAVLVLASVALTACATASISTPATSSVSISPSVTSSPTPSPAGPFSSFPAYLPDPASRMLLGTYISLSGQSTEAAIEQREAAMGHRYNLELTYYNWDDHFPDSGEATIVAHGRTPVVTWYGPGKDVDDPRTLAEVNNGSDDGWIRQQAQAIKDFGHRIYLRLMPEMNGTWYHGFSGNPTAYVSAWQRIHRLFAQEAVTNVTWVWCPNIDPDDWDQYYPGNSYVDIIGVDGFSNTKYGYQTFEQMFAGFLGHYAGRRPLMIVETATNSGNGDAAAGIGSAASFISGMHSYLETVAGPRYGLVAVCWFDTDNTDNHDWRVDQTSAAWQAWLSLARDRYFGGS